jgi:hypothetical protein
MKKIITGQLNCSIWFVFLLLFFLISLAAYSTSAEIIPVDRQVTWQGNVGVNGDIPTRTTIYTTLNPGATAAQINAAITACPSGQVIFLSAGTFNIASSIQIKSNVTLRGAGKGVTILKATSGGSFGNGIVYMGSGSYSFQAAKSISGGATKNSQTIYTSSNHGYSVGDYIYIDQLNDANADPSVTNTGNGGTATFVGRYGTNGTRAQGQINQVAAGSSGNTINLAIPLYVAYTRTPEVCKMGSMGVYSGCEDLTIDNSAYKGTMIGQFFEAANCWFKSVEFYALENTGSNSSGIKLYQAYRCTIRGCSFHETTTNPTSSTWIASDSYAIYPIPIATANLFEDNEFHHVGLAIAFQGACGGNVFAYNYVHDLWHKNQETLGCSICQHGGHSFMNLIEGNNLNPKYDADDYWGSSSQNTLFRNKIALPSSPYTLSRAVVDLQPKSGYTNVVGNVLGTAGFETVYLVTSSGSSKSIYLASNTVAATLLRHGNWDSVNGDVVWDENIADHTLPSSLYLSSKPSWYGGCTWPPVDPATGTVEDIPAKLRYEGSSCTTDTNRPSPPQGFGLK